MSHTFLLMGAIVFFKAATGSVDRLDSWGVTFLVVLAVVYDLGFIWMK